MVVTSDSNLGKGRGKGIQQL